MSMENPTFREIAAGEVAAFENAEGRLMLRCVEGALWVTKAADPNDYHLAAGASWSAGGMGRVVAQALGGPAVVVETAVPEAPSACVSEAATARR